MSAATNPVTKTAKKLVSRYGWPTTIVAGCVAAWKSMSPLLEQFQASVGPDFVARVPAKLLNFGVILIVQQFAVRFLFPTVHAFTTTEGGNKESEFRKAWKSEHKDPRLLIAIIVHLGTFVALSQIMLP